MMPVLTPIGLDPAHPFPRVFNKSLNFAVELDGRDAFGRDSRAAIVQAPRVLPRVIRLPRGVARRRARLRLPHLRPARARGRALRRHERARLLPVPRDAQQRPLRRRGGGEGPAQGAAGRAAAAPLRRRGAPGGRRHDDRADGARSCSSSSGWRPEDLYRVNGPVNLVRLMSVPDQVDRPDLKYPGLPARAAQGAREVQGHLRDAAQGRRAAAPPVPVLRAGDRLHPRGGARPAGGRDQADRVPHRHRLGDHGDADRRGARRQGGHRRGGADGALRRGGQHQLGGAAGGGRRARGLRRRRATRPTPRWRWWCGARRAGCGATSTSAPATTTRARRASTPTSACSPATRRSAPT